MTDLKLQARIENYLAKMPEAISGKRGHNALFNAAVALVQGFAMDAGEAASFLWEHYNPRCRPPWTEAEIWHKCENALHKKLVGEERGYLLRGRGDWTPKTRRRAESLSPTVIRPVEVSGKPRPTEDFIFPFVDDLGGNYHLIRRVKYSDGRKMFFQYHWNGYFFEPGLGDLPRVPMNLPKIKEASHVWLVEGEKKACDLLRYLENHGMINQDVAVTSIMGGIYGWKPELTPHFCGKHVCIVPDNDEAGWKFVQTVARELKGVAASVSKRPWPEGTPDKYDVSDAIQEMEVVK